MLKVVVRASVALGSCEAEMMAASEGIKEGLLLQEVLMFAGLGVHAVVRLLDKDALEGSNYHSKGIPLLRAFRKLVSMFRIGGVMPMLSS